MGGRRSGNIWKRREPREAIRFFGVKPVTRRAIPEDAEQAARNGKRV